MQALADGRWLSPPCIGPRFHLPAPRSFASQAAAVGAHMHLGRMLTSLVLTGRSSYQQQTCAWGKRQQPSSNKENGGERRCLQMIALDEAWGVYEGRFQPGEVWTRAGKPPH